MALGPQTPSFLRDLAAALQPNQFDADVYERARKMESLVEGITIADIPACLDFLSGQSDSETSGDLKRRLVRRWAENDPRTAAEWVSRQAAGPARQEAINSVAIVRANQNLSEAVEWVRQLPEDEERLDGLRAVAYEAARTEPMKALKLGIELPAGGVQNDLVTHAANQWAASAPEVAAEWAAGIPDAALRERVLADIATAWGESNPQAAATLAVQSLAPGKAQDDAVVGIVQRWAQNEPERAAEWVGAFPEGQLRNTAFENLVNLWADRNLVHASQWLDGLEAGESRDLAVGTFVGKLTPLAPEVAAQWAENISGEALRNQHMETVGEAWMESDATAARAWIAQMPLQEAAKARLLALKPQ